ncbi:FecCD family ABC transporter permease [Nakamurella lactea]|uniref:FecCD family ABC transporter permease n=1 Tax=Nakamurella lactea TaxID=459515 RepID=UPI0013786857|nr:iron ABC transporter permease [Nakamurella lactea]
MVSAVLLVIGFSWSLTIGTASIGIGAVLTALFGGGTTPTDMIVRAVRLPRSLLAMVAGANMSVGGVIMQGITANPIAAPEILGVSAGAAVVVVGSLTFVPGLTGTALVIAAIIGGGLVGVLVLALAGAGTGRMSNVRLALAGVTMTALLMSLTQAFVIFNDNQANNVFFWLVGGVNFAKMSSVLTVLPWTVAGLVAAMALASSLNLLGLGEDMARGLGAKVERTKILGAAVIVCLTGAAVAVAGPISFVGLVTPHLARRWTRSTNHFIVIPVSALMGATLLTYADILARFVRWPFESPTGVVTALIGAPFFVFLARKQKVSS